jgi:hypothetical protein
MDNYCINQTTNRITKIGSKAYIRNLKKNIRQNTKNKTILSDIDYEDSKKLKKSLPPLEDNMFYSYDAINKTIVTKNKSIKIDEIIQYICKKLPNIIDDIIDGIDDNATRDETKSKMIQIFHNALLT